MNDTTTCAGSPATDGRRERVRAEALSELDSMRETMRARDAYTPAVERFINEASLLIQVHVAPGEALDWVLSLIIGHRVKVRA